MNEPDLTTWALEVRGLPPGLPRTALKDTVIAEVELVSHPSPSLSQRALVWAITRLVCLLQGMPVSPAFTAPEGL